MARVSAHGRIVTTVALVDEPALRLIDGVASTYQLAALAADSGDALSRLAQDRANGHTLD